MAWTKRQFIEAAYGEIGLGEYLFNLQPEDLQKALRQLDGMLAIWDKNGIRIGWAFTSDPSTASLDTEVEVPIFATQAIVFGLACIVGSSLGKIVSPDTKRTAREGYNTLALDIPMPEKILPRRLPVGAGNKPMAGRTTEYFTETQPLPPSEVNTLEDNT